MLVKFDLLFGVQSEKDEEEGEGVAGAVGKGAKRGKSSVQIASGSRCYTSDEVKTDSRLVTSE